MQVNNLGFQIFNDQDLLHKQADVVVVFNHVIHTDRCGGPCRGQRSMGRGCDGGPEAPPRPDPAPPGAAHFLRREAAPFLLLQSAKSNATCVT